MASTRSAPSAARSLLPASLSGLLLTLAFPPGPVSFAAWFALVPLFWGVEGQSWGGALRAGLLCGLTHYLTLIYWIIVVLGRYGNLSLYASLLALILLSFYLSLYVGLFACLLVVVRDSRYWPILVPCLWTALEYLKGHLFTGFPWCLLGYTQYEQLHLIQISDIFGVYGISFLLVFSNALIFRILVQKRSGTGTPLKWEIPFFILLIAGTLVYGHIRLSGDGANGGGNHKIRAAIVQANIDQSLKWDPAYQKKTVETYRRLSLSTRPFKPGMIVWPETSLPFFFQDSRRFSPELFALSERLGAVLLFGSPAYRPVRGKIRYYNRAYMITPETLRIQYYDKTHLVPFGEYVPLKEYLPFIDRLVQGAGDFAPGKDLVPLKSGKISAGILICFEAVFPELARTLTREGANLLVNITNDAWFGMTSAPYQHLSMAVFRAVENRRPMIRAANTGFSAFIGPRGKIMARSHLFTEEVLEATLSLPRSSLTFYSRHGDLFALVVSLVSGAAVLSSLWNKRRRGQGRLNP